MRQRTACAVWVLGLAALIALVALEGAGEVWAATAVAGWGVLGVAGLQLIPMLADTLAWRRLVVTNPGPPFSRYFWIRWIGESVGSLLPAATVGGDVMRVWLARMEGGLSGRIAAASVIVDLTLGSSLSSCLRCSDFSCC